MPEPRQQRRAGFTLIELLVAITILGVIAVLGWRGLDSIVRARVALTDDLEQTRGMQLAFAQMQSDCGQLVEASVLGNRASVVSDAGRLIVVRKVYADNQPTRLQVVAYRLKDGALLRNESESTRNLDQIDQFWQAAMADNSGGSTVTLKTGIDAMTVKTWDGAGWNALAQSTQGATPPPMTGLQVTLQLHDQQALLVKAFLLGAT
ncbi:general secretion pathway protein J [Actimicrobium sp. GrIS 1.19]|uniref:PulJ/GspJ family protein n=1 Tax=Actimicrobium sp. GrIS 1.19 TaxID=3071708 RepID=UPI002E0A6CFA|nr:general secretion pathway protein J [Actimicrobium sp. GrIS 1.19]